MQSKRQKQEDYEGDDDDDDDQCDEKIGGVSQENMNV